MTPMPQGIVGVWECVSFSRTSWNEKSNMLQEQEKDAFKVWKTPLKETDDKSVRKSPIKKYVFFFKTAPPNI